MTPRVVSVNVSHPRDVDLGDRVVSTGIFKEPVERRVAVRGVNLDGDDQADRSVHGGPDKAVYAYAREDTDWWADVIGRDFGSGAFARADRPGAYLRILEEGDVGAGDPIEVVHRPDHDVTVALMSHAFLVERTRLGELLAAPELMPDWRAWIESREAG